MGVITIAGGMDEEEIIGACLTEGAGVLPLAWKMIEMKSMLKT